MHGTSPLDVVRNPVTLEAWRTYNRAANKPLKYISSFTVPFLIAPIPIMTVLVMNNQLFYAFMIPLSGLVLSLVGVTWASMKVRAYKKIHPFQLPE